MDVIRGLVPVVLLGLAVCGALYLNNFPARSKIRFLAAGKQVELQPVRYPENLDLRLDEMARVSLPAFEFGMRGEWAGVLECRISRNQWVRLSDVNLVEVTPRADPMESKPAMVLVFRTRGTRGRLLLKMETPDQPGNSNALRVGLGSGEAESFDLTLSGPSTIRGRLELEAPQASPNVAFELYPSAGAMLVASRGAARSQTDIISGVEAIRFTLPGRSHLNIGLSNPSAARPWKYAFSPEKRINLHCDLFATGDEPLALASASMANLSAGTLTVRSHSVDLKGAHTATLRRSFRPLLAQFPLTVEPAGVTLSVNGETDRAEVDGENRIPSRLDILAEYGPFKLFALVGSLLACIWYFIDLTIRMMRARH